MRFSILSTPAFNFDKVVFDLATSATGYEMQNKPPFIAYPNHLGELTIKQNQNSKAEIIKVYNLSGALVHFVTKPNNVITVPADKTPSGIYFVSSINNGRKYSQKVMVQ